MNRPCYGELFAAKIRGTDRAKFPCFASSMHSIESLVIQLVVS